MAIDPQVEMDELIEHPEIEPASDSIIPILEQLTEVLLGSWLSHSRTLRLSVLETVDHPNHWKRLVSFIEKYGSGLFTQQFLKLGSVRAILHQGVATWLEQAKEDGDHEEVNPILEAIERGELPAEEAHRCLSIVLETIIDHFTEYRDYNSTTTQSDRGEMIYMLLDFLRLRVRYDRVSWNLKPVFWAHEVLVRSALPSNRSVMATSLSGAYWSRSRSIPGTAQEIARTICHANADGCRSTRRTFRQADDHRSPTFFDSSSHASIGRT